MAVQTLRASSPGGPAEDALDGFTAALGDRLPELLREVGDLLRDDWPDYARFLDESRPAVAEAGRMFVQRLVAVARLRLVPSAPPLSTATARVAEVDAVFDQIGRMQWQRGHELTELLTAYQVGAQAAWRHVSDTALDLGLPPGVLSVLAEAVFVFVNQLSSASAHGYVLEQSESSAARERLRQELSDLLLSDRTDTATVQIAASRAGWTLPGRAAVILVDPSDPQARAVVERLDSRCLPVRRERLYGAIVPDPSDRRLRDRAARALTGAHAVVGHPVPLELLPASTQVAQIALDLCSRGLLDGDPVFASDHIDVIIAHRDERLMAVLRSQVLQPLDTLSPARRQQLTETLAAWLRTMGDRRAVAEELHIHPQTVRYRVGQLRSILGGALDSPESRAKMFLALCFGSVAS
ncbi:MAG TPA: helix-turn-helix domain-containing protein [Actinomycetales bacterium]|nr:helix-turn-helix domain-containing protein [Actinomycetales bacterium]